MSVSIASIGNYSFNNCNNLARVYSQIQTPYAVSTFNWNTCILIVPQGTKAAYKSVSGWKDAIIFEEGETIYDKVYTDGQGIKYTLSQDNAGFRYSVTGHTDQVTAELTIPDDIDGCPVTSIAYQAFQNCTNLTKVILPASLTSVSFAAFNGCTNLTEFVSQIQDPTKATASMSSEVTARAILWVPGGSKAAYLATSGWKDFIIYEEGVDVAFDRTPTDEQGVKYLLSQSAGNLYYSVTGHSDALAKRVIIPTELDGVPVTHIAAGSFKDCTELTWIYIPESIIEMPSREETFNGCSLTLALNQETVSGWSVSPFITGLEIGNNVKTIDSYAFWGCRSLASIEWPQNQQTLTVKSLAFEYCTGLTEITIPKGLSIDDGAFSGCTSVEKVNWNAATCGTRPRGWFPSVRELYIGKDVTTIDYGVTSGCANLERIVVDAENTTYDSRGNCNAIIDTAGNGLVAGCKNTVIPNNITSIWMEAFKDHTGLTSVTIPASVTIIGINAFSGCTGLTSVTIPASVTRIGGTVNNSYLTPGNNAFKGCTSIIHVTSYIQKPFGVNAFDSETLASATLTVPFGRRGFYQKVSGWGFQNIEEMEGNEEETTFIQFADATTKSICIGKWDENGDGEISQYEAKLVTSVSSYFNGTNITSFDELKYFTGVTEISNSAFSNCKNLTSIILPDGVNSIGSYAFQNCSALKDITLPEGLTSIGTYAFSGTSLMEMTLPSTLTSIGNYALAGYIIHCRFSTPFSVYRPHSGNASNVLLYVPQGSEQLFRNATGWKDFIVMGNGNEQIDWAEGQITVTVEAAGGLRLALIELDDEEITRLKIRGPLNSEDIKYLTEGKGKIANLESLDLGEVTLIYDGGCYKQESGASDTGFGSVYGYYYLTEEESVTRGVSLGIASSTTTTICSPYLVGVFEGKGYRHLVMPRSVIKAANSVFSGCKNLQDVEFPGGLKAIGESAFNGCEQLYSINLEHVDTIPNRAFAGCRALQKVEHLKNVKYIGEWAFYGCYRLAGQDGTLSLSRLETISKGTFSDCVCLRKVHLSGVRSIGEQAFYNCTTLTDVVLSDGLTIIGDEAFSGCSLLQQVSYPASLRGVNYTCFQETPFMEALPVEDGIKYMGTIALSYNASASTPATLSFREGTTMIADRFMETISNSGNVTALSLPLTLRHIGASAFSNNNLSTLTLPENLKSIGKGAFYNSKVLTKVTLSESLELIGESAFSSCPKLTIVNFNAREVQGQNAFSGCSSLEKVNVGGSVRLLPSGIFSNCGNLTLVKFAGRSDNAPLTIGDKVFEGCQNLVSPALPLNTKAIGDAAFSSCQAITSLTLPSSLESIGSSAFSRCYGLTSIIVPDKVTAIQGRTFEECSNLNSVSLPAGLKVVGDYAFSGCSNLASIELPIGLDSIGAGAFTQCWSFTELTRPATVTRLGSNILYDCYNLTMLESRIARPDDVGGVIRLSPETTIRIYSCGANWQLYQDNHYDEVTLIVPDGSKPLYKAAKGWNMFKNIQEASGSDITATNKLSVSHTYVTAGQQTGLEVRFQNNVTDFTAYQFDLVTPRGFSIAANSQGVLKVRQGNRYADETVTIVAEQLPVSQYVDMAKYRIVCISPSNTAITGHEGILLTITLKAHERKPVGDYNATLENVIFAKTDGTKVELDYVPFTITVEADENGLMGDVDRDGVVDVADVVQTVNYILGTEEDLFSTHNADVNGDGEVNIGDVVLIAGIIAGDRGNAASVKSAADLLAASTEALLTCDFFGNMLTVDLQGQQDYTAFQMRLTTPQDIGRDQVDMMLKRGTDHVLVTNWLSEHEVIIVAYSMSRQSFTGTEGTLLQLMLDWFSESDWLFDDIVFAHADGTTWKYAPLSISYATGVRGVQEQKPSDDDSIYDLSGRQIVNGKLSNGKLPRGIYIMNGKIVMVK